ncbi:RNA polymerase sigma factor [Enterococcus sp. LJL90]
MDELYQEYGELVYRFLLGLTNDELLAEDLTQETFYQAIKSLENFQGNSKVSTWLCQISKNLWRQHMAKNKQHKVTDELLASYADDDPRPDEQLLHSENKVRIYQIIHELSEIKKEVVLLRMTNDFSFREIGDIFGKSENWARVTFYRAKQKIVERMRQDDNST